MSGPPPPIEGGGTEAVGGWWSMEEMREIHTRSPLEIWLNEALFSSRFTGHLAGVDQHTTIKLGNLGIHGRVMALGSRVIASVWTGESQLRGCECTGMLTCTVQAN
ncbi:hypothetical protein QYF36_021542 [Acer negundo]|nr:hypothetical protein QYF36_021542 [Acer negundo]